MSARAVALAMVVGGAVGSVSAAMPAPAPDTGDVPADALAALRRAVEAQRMATGGALTLRAVLRRELPASGESWPPKA